MAEISRSALLSYPIKQVFDLINDIAAYPGYMDGCVSTEVIKRDKDFMEARLELAKGGFKHSFTTKNTLMEPDGNELHTVKMELVEGPFKQFSGLWTLLPLGDSACKVSLDLQFILNNKVLSAASKSLFMTIADNLVNAMVNRAHHLYQNQSAS